MSKTITKHSREDAQAVLFARAANGEYWHFRLVVHLSERIRDEFPRGTIDFFEHSSCFPAFLSLQMYVSSENSRTWPPSEFHATPTGYMYREREREVPHIVEHSQLTWEWGRWIWLTSPSPDACLAPLRSAISYASNSTLYLLIILLTFFILSIRREKTSNGRRTLLDIKPTRLSARSRWKSYVLRGTRDEDVCPSSRDFCARCMYVHQHNLSIMQ